MDIPKYKSIDIDLLIPYARNSRTHSDSQVTKIASSIKEFGFLNPVIVDKDNGIEELRFLNRFVNRFIEPGFFKEVRNVKYLLCLSVAL